MKYLIDIFRVEGNLLHKALKVCRRFREKIRVKCERATSCITPYDNVMDLMNQNARSWVYDTTLQSSTKKTLQNSTVHQVIKKNIIRVPVNKGYGKILKSAKNFNLKSKLKTSTQILFRPNDISVYPSVQSEKLRLKIKSSRSNALDVLLDPNKEIQFPKIEAPQFRTAHHHSKTKPQNIKTTQKTKLLPIIEANRKIWTDLENSLWHFNTTMKFQALKKNSENIKACILENERHFLKCDQITVFVQERVHSILKGASIIGSIQVIEGKLLFLPNTVFPAQLLKEEMAENPMSKKKDPKVPSMESQTQLLKEEIAGNPKINKIEPKVPKYYEIGVNNVMVQVFQQKLMFMPSHSLKCLLETEPKSINTRDMAKIVSSRNKRDDLTINLSPKDQITEKKGKVDQFFHRRSTIASEDKQENIQKDNKKTNNKTTISKSLRKPYEKQKAEPEPNAPSNSNSMFQVFKDKLLFTPSTTLKLIKHLCKQEKNETSELENVKVDNLMFHTIGEKLVFTPATYLKFVEYLMKKAMIKDEEKVMQREMKAIVNMPANPSDSEEDETNHVAEKIVSLPKEKKYKSTVNSKEIERKPKISINEINKKTEININRIEKITAKTPIVLPNESVAATIGTGNHQVVDNAIIPDQSTLFNASKSCMHFKEAMAENISSVDNNSKSIQIDIPMKRETAILITHTEGTKIHEAPKMNISIMEQNIKIKPEDSSKITIPYEDDKTFETQQKFKTSRQHLKENNLPNIPNFPNYWMTKNEVLNSEDYEIMDEQDLSDDKIPFDTNQYFKNKFYP